MPDGCDSLNSVDLAVVADELIRADDERRLTSPPSMGAGFDFSDAYQVAALMHQDRIARGVAPVGIKLGFTNRTVWDAHGLDSPFWSYVYSDSVSSSQSVDIAPLVQPRVEPELVLGLQADVAPGADDAELASTIAWAAVGVELVHCHYRDWQMTPPDAIADRGLHAALRIGRHVEISAESLNDLSTVFVELSCDGSAVAQGVGSNALGGPFEALRWLVRLPGVPTLRAGWAITTGTLTPALPATAGQTWSVRGSAPFEDEYSIKIVR